MFVFGLVSFRRSRTSVFMLSGVLSVIRYVHFDFFTGIPIWVIIIIIALIIVVIGVIGAVLFGVPSIRRKVLPHRDRDSWRPTRIGTNPVDDAKA